MLLTCLMEEAAEVQKEAAKCLRFGTDNVDPEDSAGRTNAEKLRDELIDHDSIYCLLVNSCILPNDRDHTLNRMTAKIEKVLDSLECSDRLGRLTEDT